jgi:hypothetical protein
MMKSNLKWFAWSMLFVGLMVLADVVSRWY